MATHSFGARSTVGSKESRGSAAPTSAGNTSGLVKAAEAGAKDVKGRALRAFKKFNNDWTMNLVAMVSFNVLTSFFPLILALITLIAFLPPVVNNHQAIAKQIETILPSNISSQVNVDYLFTQVNTNIGLLSLISIVGLIWAGTNLFGSIEGAFAIIFRVKVRNFLPQKLMSVMMIIIFAVLLPISFASTILLSAATTSLSKILPSFLTGPFAVVISYVTTITALFVLFLAIYTIVPNVPIRWRYAWRGALLAGVAMTIVNNIFPYYTAHFLGTKQYGTAALATSIVLVTWFWFFSLVLLIGAQINALTMGIGYWKYDLTRTLMDQRIPTLGGAPTAEQALRRTHDADVFDTPVGLARDAEKAEETDKRGRGDRKSDATRSEHGAVGTASDPVQANLRPGHPNGTAKHNRLHLSALTSRHRGNPAVKPRRAEDMPDDLVATGIGEGGVVMGRPDRTAGALPGLIGIGVAVGIARWFRTIRRESK